MTENALKSQQNMKKDLFFMEAEDRVFLYYIVKNHSQTMWGYAYYLTQNKDLADDIVQTVFLKIIMHIGTLKALTHENKVKAYLKISIKNTFADYLRKNKNTASFLPLETIEDYPDPVTTDEQVVEKMFNETLLDEIYASLTEKEKELLTLYYYVGLTMEQIAQTENMTKQGVSIALKRIQLKVKTKWGYNGYEKA